jgi:hypothetical protein
LTEEVPLLSSTSHANKSSKLKESVLFTWSSSLLDKSKKTPLADSSYELYCVLFNMAVSHLMSCRQGQNESNVTTCLETAGIFEYLETTLGEVNSDDISSEITGYLKKLCVSLAEESVSFLCLEQEEKFESMARVMRDSAKNYESLWSTFNSRFQNMKDFTLYLKYKAVSCDILSVLFSAVYYNKTDENGNGLALLDFCTKQMPRLKEVYEQYSKKCKTVSIHNSWIVEKLEYYQGKFKKQNDLVYHQKVPDILPEILSEKPFGKIKQFTMVPVSKEWTREVYEKYSCEPVVVPQGDSIQKGGNSSENKDDEKEVKSTQKCCQCQIQ